jgi:hypothetical protein
VRERPMIISILTTACPPQRDDLPTPTGTRRRVNRSSFACADDFAGLPIGLFHLRRPTADLRDVLLLDAIKVELRRAGDDLVQRLVEVERRRPLRTG